MKKELVIVIDFGGQYNQLVARRVRECNVYCEIYSYKTDIEKIKAMNPKGIILTGGPNSCYEADSPTYKKELFELGIPVLGLCYGAQLMMHVLGGKVESAPVREYGKTEVLVDKKDSKIFEGVSEKTICWMSHFDYISQVAPGFEITAHTADCPVAAAENTEAGLYAIQYHPEVLHTAEGTKMLSNFVLGLRMCRRLEDGCIRREYNPGDPRKSRRRKSTSCTVRRSRFFSGSRIVIQSYRKAVDMCICRSWSSP